MVKNSTIRNLIEDSISSLRSSYNTIEDQLAPSGGNAAVGISGLLPGAGIAIFSKFVNNIRPVSSKLNSCIKLRTKSNSATAISSPTRNSY